MSPDMQGVSASHREHRPLNTELSQPIQLLDPKSGEALTLESPTEDLTQLMVNLREFELLLKEEKSLVNRELIRRLDFARKWTKRVPGYKISTASSPNEEQWDGAALREALCLLVDEGELPIEAVNEAVEVVVDHKVKKAGINALRAGGGQAAEVVDALCIKVPKDRYVKVERS